MVPAPDFKKTAESLALNEACDISDPASAECRFDSLCPFCQALAKTIELNLIKAFLAGQQAANLPVTPHRVG
jgi:hypothetical protein